MKIKSLVANPRLLSVFWKQPGARLPRGAAFSSGYGLILLTVIFFLSLPISHGRAEETGALLENITFDRESTIRETVSFKLNGPHIPKMFAVKGDVPKVVFDFYDTRHSAAIKGVIKSQGNLILAIRTGMHRDPQLKTRVVLDLVPAGDYDFAMDFKEKENILIVTIFHTQQKKETQQHEKVGGKTKKDDVVPVKPAPPAKPVKKDAAPSKQVQEKKTEPSPVASPDIAVKTAPAASSPLLINTISFEQNGDKGEKVLFHLSNFRPPVIFGIEEGEPSIVCDFLESQLGDKVPESIVTKGKFVKQVRVEKHPSAHKTRVVLDLAPNRHYDLRQVFYKEENLYVLFVNSSDKIGLDNSLKP